MFNVGMRSCSNTWIQRNGLMIALMVMGALMPVILPGDQVDGCDPSRALHVFVGRYTRETTGDSAKFWETEYENNYHAGIAYRRDVYSFSRRTAAGGEIGLVARFPERWSFESWGGMYLRHAGLPLVRRVLVKPSLTLGLSLVDRAIGKEREREARGDRDARLLYYFGPEFAFSTAHRPDWEIVLRLHHRSGGMQTLGNMSEGHNAVTLGMRKHFR